MCVLAGLRQNIKQSATGTIVQLCAVRHKRKLSAKLYKGVARITCRNAERVFITEAAKTVPKALFWKKSECQKKSRHF